MTLKQKTKKIYQQKRKFLKKNSHTNLIQFTTFKCVELIVNSLLRVSCSAD